MRDKEERKIRCRLEGAGVRASVLALRFSTPFRKVQLGINLMAVFRAQAFL